MTSLALWKNSAVPWGSDDSEKTWLRTVSLGAQGRYLPAWRLMAPLLGRASASPEIPDRWASLAASTRASHLRQIGCGEAAIEWDTIARRCAPVDDEDADALADALVGGAADQLVGGNVPAAVRGWTDARSVVQRAGQRARVRWHWVGTEIALARGSLDQAQEESSSALDAASGLGSRHRTKTALIASAVSLARSETQVASAHLHVAQGLLARGGWPTLWWPAALLWLDLAAVGVRDPAAEVAIRAGARAVQVIDLHVPATEGARWRARPDVRRILEGAERYSAGYGAAR
jgi:hypothetical protein